MKKHIRNKAVFIHSLFKTGSTYLWLKFRQNENCYCYYEPFHHFMLEIDGDYETTFTKEDTIIGDKLTLNKHYLYEYEKLLKDGQKGLPFFNKSFVFDRFCDNSENLDVKKYINYLINGASDKMPVLKFNRTALRTRWFKKKYPDALHLYLVRNPRDQWESYISKAKKGGRIFIVMDLMISSLNLDHDYFQALFNYLPLIDFRHDDFQKEMDFYDLIGTAYSDEEKYFIFYYIWFVSYIENILNADITVNINLLSRDAHYREQLCELLMSYGVEDVDFDDAKVREYEEFNLGPEIMETVEQQVRKVVLDSLPGEKIDHFIEKVPTHDQQYFNFSKEGILDKKIRGEASLSVDQDVHKKVADKYKKVIFLLYDEINKLPSTTRENEILRNLLRKKKEELDCQRQMNLDIYNSYTYRAGRIVVWPVVFLKKLYELLKSWSR